MVFRDRFFKDFVLKTLGIWLILSMFIFKPEENSLFFTNLISGCILLSGKKTLGLLMGGWLQLAPLVFWASEGFSYFNNTLIGILVTGYCLLTPQEKGKGSQGPIPPGWSFNPSEWSHRLPLIILAGICSLTSRYLALYQLGYLPEIWDPIFGDGSQRVVHSALSQSLPLSDAGFGAVVYTFEFFLAFKGGDHRWYQHPRLIIFLEALVIPSAFFSFLLLLSQPFVVGAWCFWCIVTACFAFLMVSFSLDEFLASYHHLFGRPEKQIRHPSLKEIDNATVRLESAQVKPKRMSIPYFPFLSYLLGIGIVFSEQILNLESSLGAFTIVLGILVTVFSLLSVAEIARSFRLINVLLGLILLLSHLIDGKSSSQAYYFLMGLALVLMNISKGSINRRYGRLEKSIF